MINRETNFNYIKWKSLKEANEHTRRNEETWATNWTKNHFWRRNYVTWTSIIRTIWLCERVCYSIRINEKFDYTNIKQIIKLIYISHDWYYFVRLTMWEMVMQLRVRSVVQFIAVSRDSNRVASSFRKRGRQILPRCEFFAKLKSLEDKRERRLARNRQVARNLLRGGSNRARRAILPIAFLPRRKRKERNISKKAISRETRKRSGIPFVKVEGLSNVTKRKTDRGNRHVVSSLFSANDIVEQRFEFTSSTKRE